MNGQDLARRLYAANGEVRRAGGTGLDGWVLRMNKDDQNDLLGDDVAWREGYIQTTYGDSGARFTHWAFQGVKIETDNDLPPGQVRLRAEVAV